MPRILFVSGFHTSMRARDLAHEFERFGRLVRCDVPAPRGAHANNPYAFIEFRSDRDAEDAYYDMHGRNFDGCRLSVQWAKSPPSSVWRYERQRSPPPPRRRRSRSASPRRSDRDREEPRDRDRDRGDRGRGSRRSRSRSRERISSDDKKKRTPSPRAKTPPRASDEKKSEVVDRARTPPYDG